MAAVTMGAMVSRGSSSGAPVIAESAGGFKQGIDHRRILGDAVFGFERSDKLGDEVIFDPLSQLFAPGLEAGDFLFSGGRGDRGQPGDDP